MVAKPFLGKVSFVEHFSFRIYLDMLNVYKVMSENITAAITHNGEQVIQSIAILTFTF